MSMLAEPKRKQRISLNPNGLAYSQDESNIGQKLLCKMGWEKGRGLGSNKQGDTNPICLKMNIDNRGLGCSRKQADKWVEHQDEFNSLLNELNHARADDDSQGPAAEVKVSSLEERSRASRARVHYMKFTKGKDLSRHSDQDLAVIFGRRSGQSTPLTNSNTPSCDNSENEAEPSPDPFLSDTTTHTSSLSLQEYFANKMAQKRSKGSSSSLKTDKTPSPTDSISPPTDEPDALLQTTTYPTFFIGEDTTDSTLTKPNKKKHKKKHRSRETHNEDRSCSRGGKSKPSSVPFDATFVTDSDADAEDVNVDPEDAAVGEPDERVDYNKGTTADRVSSEPSKCPPDTTCCGEVEDLTSRESDQIVDSMTDHKKSRKSKNRKRKHVEDMRYTDNDSVRPEEEEESSVHTEALGNTIEECIATQEGNTRIKKQKPLK